MNSKKNTLDNKDNATQQNFDYKSKKKIKKDLEDESIYKHIFESLVEGVVFLNSEGDVELINNGAREISSSNLREVKDFVANFREKVIDDNYNPFPVVKQPAIIALAERRPVKNVQVGVPLDDQYRWLLVNAHPVYNVYKRFIGVVSSFIDVTDLKLQRDELRKAKFDLQISEKSLKMAQDISQSGSFIWNLKNDTIEWSDELLRLYDMTKEESVQDLQKLINTRLFPEDRERVLERNKLAREGKKTPPVEYRIRRKDGTVRTLWSKVGDLVYDDEGNPDLMVGVALDITERKKEEEKRLFEQSNQQALRLESLSFLAGGIAHDFNNILGGIYGYLDLALKESKESKNSTILNYLENALKSMTRARSLTDQLLTFTKSGVPNKELTSIEKLLIETTNFVLSGTSITSEIKISEDLWSCAVDKGQIGQVIENIVLNAVQSMHRKGSIHILAENVILDEPGVSNKFIKISFKDTGKGMSKDTLNHIFEPFFTTKKNGHGLGLATSYSIIKNHDGTIKVESTIDEGSVFTVFLPATNKEIAIKNKSVFSSHKGEGLILVLDDEEDIQTILRINLESLGYSVITSKSGTEIVNLLKKDEIKTTIKSVFLDLTIPGELGGKELINSLRKGFSMLPIFVISGYSEDPIITRPQEYGFTASLKKPFTRKEIEILLNRFVSKKI